jgi:3',5'-cyclic AMP phosphodiesterase CpdA
VLATGDLTAWGRTADYERLAELVAPLRVPVLAIPGNHDDRDGVRATFPDLPWADAEHASWVTEIAGVRVIGLDSTVPGAAGAAFDDAREAWLVDVLAQRAEGVTILTMHHPPFRTGIGWMDRSGFDRMARFAAVVEGSDVDRIFCGHLHRPIVSEVGGVPVQVGLPTIELIELDLEPGARPRLVLDPIAYNLVAIADDGIVTHTRFVETGQRPFTPDWADLYD